MILGASCRFAAESATRAGWAVHAADLFGDGDLAAVAASTRRVARYPDGLVEAAAAFPDAPWCYTGAVENHRHVIARVSAVRPLAGNGVTAVHRVRDPAALAALVRTAGLCFPDTFAAPCDVPTDGTFLCKPLASAGGRAIAPWTAADTPATPGFVWQRCVAGEALSAVLALTDHDSRLLGVSHQLVGAPWCRAARFAYTGSIWIRPADVPATARAQFETLAAALARHAGLRGIVGVDAIIDREDRVTVIEINPRPTASAELVERATGESILGTHLAAFGLGSPVSVHSSPPGDPIWSKAILFTADPVTIDDPMLDRLRALCGPWTDADGLPAMADIPRPGQVLRCGAPIVTAFARGHTATESIAELRRRIDTVISVTG